MNDFLYFSNHWGKWDNSDIVECRPGDEMNQDRFNAMQETYDNMEAPFDEGLQTQEEIDAENDQEFRYNRLMEDAVDMGSESEFAFYQFILDISEYDTHKDAQDVIRSMISKAADYNGSEATVPDFVRLVRMAFEWKAKQ